MRIRIFQGCASGTVIAPASKSVSHRKLICAALAGGTSVLRGLSDCEDTRATVDCLRALGARISLEDDCATVTGFDPRRAPSATLPCRESGSTLRFLLPLALLAGQEMTFTGSEKLLSRPLGVYEALCREHGFLFERAETSCLVKWTLSGGIYTLPGDISSQFVSGLLFALPLCREDSRIRLVPPVESRSYIDLTLAALRGSGISAVWEDACTLFVEGGQTYTAQNTTVEGDWSGAAFPLALGHLGGRVSVEGLDEKSVQGDRVCASLFDKLDTGFCTISIGDCPDLAPILFTLAAAKQGARFEDTRRLSVKESDRARVMAEELSKCGARVTVEDNAVTVEASALRTPTEPLLGHNDHRIVMALSVLLTTLGGVIDGAEAITKSYPTFFDHLRTLGIRVEEE